MTFLSPLFEKGVLLILENPVGQTTGFIAMFIIFYAFTVKDDRKLVYILCISNIFWLLHFFLLGNIGAFVATIVASIRLFLSLKYQKNYVMLAFVATLSIALGYFSYEGALSLLPIMATIFASYAFFFLEKVPLRIYLLIVSAMWLYYHIQTGSISGMINEVVVLATLCLTIYRFMFEKEKYSYDIDTGKISFRKRFLMRLRKRPNYYLRLDLGRLTTLRDMHRFTKK